MKTIEPRFADIEKGGSGWDAGARATRPQSNLPPELVAKHNFHAEFSCLMLLFCYKNANGGKR